MNNHLKYALLCQEAYKLSNKSTGFYYYQSGNIIIISGTDHLMDWHDNIRVFRPTVNGFHNRFEYYAQLILEDINDFTTDFTIIGHSAGGCIAEYLALMTDNNAVSFGAPVIYFKKVLNNKSKIIRYQLKYDPVPRLSWGVRNCFNANTLVLPGWGHKIHHYINKLK